MKRVLILGARGKFGRNAAEAFEQAGWDVRRFQRGKDDLSAAATGVDVIVNGWNAPYHRKGAELPGQTAKVIAAARASGATVLLPSNVYVFGRDAPERYSPQTPHRATNPLGQVQREMEAAYRAADVQTILVRAGDFIDTVPTGNWFDRVIAAKAARGVLSYPGDFDTPHAWAFLPDLAQAVVALAEMRESLPRYSDLCFAGYTLTARDLSDAVSSAVGPQRLKRMRWLPIWLLRPVMPMASGLLEMRYLWSKPHHLDGEALDALCPGLPSTPVEQAMRRALAHHIHPDQTMTRALA